MVKIFCFIKKNHYFIAEELEAKQEEPAPKKLKLDEESDISEPSEEPAKDLDENDGANLAKSPEVFDDDEKEPLVIDDNSELGIIHILRKHLYSTKLNLTSKFFTRTGFFFRQNKRISFSTLQFDEIFMLKFEIFST